MKNVIRKLDGTELNGKRIRIVEVSCVAYFFPEKLLRNCVSQGKRPLLFMDVKVFVLSFSETCLFSLFFFKYFMFQFCIAVQKLFYFGRSRLILHKKFKCSLGLNYGDREGCRFGIASAETYRDRFPKFQHCRRICRAVFPSNFKETLILFQPENVRIIGKQDLPRCTCFVLKKLTPVGCVC